MVMVGLCFDDLPHVLLVEEPASAQQRWLGGPAGKES